MSLAKLKLFGYALAGIGMIIANEVQKRETREAVEEILAEREVMAENNPYNLDELP